MKALVVYGTRYGSTANTSKIIADVLSKEGFEVSLFDLKKKKIKDIGEYDLVIVGSGIRIGKWTKEPENFLEKFQKELIKKKVAIFVCCGSATPLSDDEEKVKEIEEAKRKYLDEKAEKYGLHPISLGFFGGAYNFNKMSWFFRKTLSGIKSQLEEAGYRETKKGYYDLRNLDKIRKWIKNVADSIKE